MFIQISHTRIGKLDLHAVYEKDQPEGPLTLLGYYLARQFHGSIRAAVFDARDTPLFLFDFNLKPEVELAVAHGEGVKKLLLVTHGSLLLVPREGEKLFLQKNTMAVFCGSDYSVELAESTRVQYCVLDIAPFEQRLAISDLTGGRYVASLPVQVQLGEIMNPPALVDQPERWLSNRISQLLLALDESIAVDRTQAGQKSNKRDYAVAAALLIRTNPDKKFSTVQLAKAVNLNECALKKAFKKEHNTSIASIQRKQRVEMTKDMMLQTDKTLLAIAMECGFGSERTFRDNFFQFTGYSPKFWRKKNKVV
ncbi:helix-turn-helix domain-containing protein [Flavihumibacter petaseus]|uniref:helix-turn-helix domain-containing protein n=1 Tax=Flavihumibacter petaseus TaxID=549295 RepID=UPI00146FEC8F|nr:AraC family transcriptional regulator [Flavihumibacter petaseus]